MANLLRVLVSTRAASSFLKSRTVSSPALGLCAETKILDFRSNCRGFITQAQFHSSRPVPKDCPQPPQSPLEHASAKPSPATLASNPIPKTDYKPSTLLLVLRRIALAYLLSMSLCLAWTGVNGWYLVLNGRGDEVDERSPLMIVWDATRWPADVSRRLLRGS
jgi:hypothetical protein